MTLMQPLVWITGSHGLIGNYLVHGAPRLAPQWRVRALTRADFDLLDFSTVEREFRRDLPAVVIHCAAITQVADAHKEPAFARRMNVDVTRLLAGLAAERAFAFYSTDLVFDGHRGNYVETDAPNPLHIYGETKLAAEEIVLKNPRHLVIRTSINGGVSRAGNRAFNEQLHRSMQSVGWGMTMFTDEFRCPIPAVETARATWELLAKGCAGLYHVAGAEKLSRFQIGELLVKRWPGLAGKFKAGSARDFPGPARALDTSLNISKVQPVLSRPLPGLGEWLAANPQVEF